MLQNSSKIQIMFSMVAVLCLFMASSATLKQGWAAKQASSVSEHPSSLNLMVMDGKVSGRFKDRPLAEILDFIGKTMGFEYQANKQLRAERVSHEFDHVPLMEATKNILAPFNYMIETDGSGRIKHIFISGRRNAPRGTTQLDAQKDQGKGLDGDTMKASPGLEFGAAITQGSGPPPELIELFYPQQEPGTELTGPQGSENHSATEQSNLQHSEVTQGSGPSPENFDLFYPQQEPGTELTGPPVPEGYITEEFIHFEPTESDSGPMAPDNGMVELPEFEPVISETGPGIGKTE